MVYGRSGSSKDPPEEIAMRKKAIFWWLLLALIVIVPVLAGIHHDGPYSGKIIDAETGEPIEGAAVIGIWYVGEYGHAEAPIFKFLEAKETVSGKDGEFIIPSITAFHRWPLAKLFDPYLKIFKPGYGSYERDFYSQKEGEIFELNKLKTKKERTEALISVDVCGLNADDTCIPKNKIPHIIEIIDKEVKDLKLN